MSKSIERRVKVKRVGRMTPPELANHILDELENLRVGKLQGKDWAQGLTDQMILEKILEQARNQ